LIRAAIGGDGVASGFGILNEAHEILERRTIFEGFFGIPSLKHFLEKSVLAEFHGLYDDLKLYAKN